MNSFPDVKISAARLDVREFGPEDASLVRAVLVQDAGLTMESTR